MTTKDLQQQLKDQWETFTASEQKIASYLLQHLRDLPFETAASLSKRVGVSPMTVGRFLRNLGYEGFGELKEELRGDSNWRQLYRYAGDAKGAETVSAHLQAEVRALTEIHALAGSKEWKSIIKLLISADRVSVASFQHGAFLGMAFATMLQQLRPRVTFNSGSDGAYIDMLLDSSRNSCIVLIDVRRYFRQFRLLAEEASKRGIPLVLITDTECYWARELTPHVLMAEADRVWHTYSAFMSLFSLLTASIVQEVGGVMDRLGDINELRQKMVGYIGAPVEPVGLAVGGEGKKVAASKKSSRPRK